MHRALSAALMVGIASSLAAPGLAQEDLEERVRGLEESMERLEEKIDRLLAARAERVVERVVEAEGETKRPRILALPAVPGVPGVEPGAPGEKPRVLFLRREVEEEVEKDERGNRTVRRVIMGIPGRNLEDSEFDVLILRDEDEDEDEDEDDDDEDALHRRLKILLRGDHLDGEALERLHDHLRRLHDKDGDEGENYFFEFRRRGDDDDDRPRWNRWRGRDRDDDDRPRFRRWRQRRSRDEDERFFHIELPGGNSSKRGCDLELVETDGDGVRVRIRIGGKAFEGDLEPVEDGDEEGEKHVRRIVPGHRAIELRRVIEKAEDLEPEAEALYRRAARLKEFEGNLERLEKLLKDALENDGDEEDEDD